jgi:hypothetical protein
MADYYGKTRTNYFSVTDEEKFRKIMETCKGSGDIEIFDEKQADGSVKFGFYCEGSIHGIASPEDEGEAHYDEKIFDFSDIDEEFRGYDEDYDVDIDYNYDAFCEALQQILPDNEAIIITETGYEAMRYLTGDCTIITRSGFECIDIKRIALGIARDLLKNPEFTTKMDY